MKLKLGITVLFTLSAVLVASGVNWPGPFTVKKVFKSPTGIREIVVVTTPSPQPNTPPIELIGKMVNGSFVEAKNLAKTVYRREYHGNGWILGQQPIWIDDRLMCAQDEDGLFVADAETNTILFNNVLEAYAKDPVADKWVAIRFRPSARIQEYLEEGFQDTLLFIDPADMAAQAARDLPKDSLAHIKSMRIDGVALGPPQWVADGSRFGVLVWKNGAVAAVRYDTQLRETARTAVDLQVDRKTALSVWLNKELTPVVKRILSDPRTFESAVPSSVPQSTYSPHQ
jgi:hypothetical protein